MAGLGREENLPNDIAEVPKDGEIIPLEDIARHPCECLHRRWIVSPFREWEGVVMVNPAADAGRRGPAARQQADTDAAAAAAAPTIVAVDLKAIVVLSAPSGEILGRAVPTSVILPGFAAHGGPGGAGASHGGGWGAKNESGRNDTNKNDQITIDRYVMMTAMEKVYYY